VFGGAVMPYRQGSDTTLEALAPLSGLGVPGETDSVNKNPINRVCLFENEIHNIGQGRWDRQDETTGSWVSVVNLNHYQVNTAYQNIGLYPVFNQVTNKRYLVTAYLTSTVGNATWVGIAYNKDDNIVTSGLITSQSQGASHTDFSPQDCQLGNDIYFVGSNTDGRLMILNGLNLEISGDTLTGMNRPVDLCAYSGSVYAAYRDTTVLGVGGSGVVTIGRVIAGRVKKILHLPFEDLSASFPSNPELGYAVTVNTDIPQQKCVLFVDNNPITATGVVPDMWLYYWNMPQKHPSTVPETFFQGAGIPGWSVWRLRGDGLGGLSVIEQDDELMGNWRAGYPTLLAFPWTQGGSAGILSVCDNYPGWFVTNPEKSFLTLRPLGGEPGQTHRQWDFDPPNSPASIAGVTILGLTKMSYSQDKLGGGARWSPAATSTTTGDDVNIFDIAYTSGHFVGPNNDSWRIHFKLMPSTAYHAGYRGVAGAGMSVRWYYDKFHAPNKRCTLSSPGNSSHGTATNDQVNGLTLSSGVDYWVDWNYRADNFGPNDRLYLCGLLFDPNNSDIPPLGL
jgi:hypothetical protein